MKHAAVLHEAHSSKLHVCFPPSPVSPSFLQGEESVKERFTLDEGKVVPFLEQEYTLEEVSSWGGSSLLVRL